MENLIKQRWDEILDVLIKEHDISDVSYRTWLKPLKVHAVKNHTVTILVQEELGIDYIKRKYSIPIKVTIEEVIGEEFEIEFIVPSQIKNITPQSKLPISNNTSNAVYNNLIPRYTFDTFVVGNNNKLAHAAALAVAESPAEAYNPLFIYGGVGLGKTHLMHSIAHFILDKNSEAKVLYVSSEKFTNELIDSIRHDKNEEFRQKYRNIDVLLIDDIQFVVGKVGTQEEFFHTFNTLHEAKKQIIISSDKPPKDIETLEERLRSRFEWGLTCDIQSPDYETRMAILRKKEELENLNIDNDVMQYVATNIKSNIRELEGALNKIVAYSTLVHKEITLSLAEDVLKDLITPDGRKELTPSLIIDIVAEHYNISAEDIISKKRTREIAYPRQIVMYLCRKLTESSLQNIGKILGNRDHTTIIHGAEKIHADMAEDASIKNTIEVLIKKITSI